MRPKVIAHYRDKAAELDSSSGSEEKKEKEKKGFEVPIELCCPIGTELRTRVTLGGLRKYIEASRSIQFAFTDPVIAADNQTYEREIIQINILVEMASLFLVFKREWNECFSFDIFSKTKKTTNISTELV